MIVAELCSMHILLINLSRMVTNYHNFLLASKLPFSLITLIK